MKEKPITHHPVYKEGERVYFLNRAEMICPYETDTDEYDLFERGWVQAHKRSSSRHSVDYLDEPSELVDSSPSNKVFYRYKEK